MSDNKTAGQMLFEARTSGRRKREISTISKLLCIREEYLDALEKGDYNSIPEVVYILGFARNYAMELGLDPTEIVIKIKKEIGLIEDADVENPMDEEVEEEPVAAVLPVKKEKKTNKFIEQVSGFVVKNWKWLLGGLVALVVLIIVIVAIASPGKQSGATEVATVAEEVIKEPEYSREIREKFGTENAADANVIVQAIGESWIKVEDARGNTVFSRVLVPGDVYYVPANSNYKGTFGNAGGVDIWVNGKLTPKLGALNTRKTGVVLTPEGLMPGQE